MKTITMKQMMISVLSNRKHILRGGIMLELLKLTKQYDKSTHLSHIPVNTNILKNLKYIYEPNWNIQPESAPYEIITQLIDCYYCLPERPDLAALFCWQAINHSYNQYLLSDPSAQRLQDTKGITELISHISNNFSKYEPYLKPYYMNITDKTYRYVASYILKGYAIEKSGFSEKYISSSYITFKKKFPSLFDTISNSYGYVYHSITTAVLTGNKVSLNICDSAKSKNIIRSFSSKLRELIENGTTQIDEKHPVPMRQTINFTDKDKVTFLLFSILYASRCNNFHGNVASRLNSIYANKESFVMYTNIFLLEYIILAIALNEQKILSDSTLLKLQANEHLIIT